MASLLVTFTVSFDEFVLAFFLSGNQPTLPVYIWSQIRFPGQAAEHAGAWLASAAGLGGPAGRGRIFPPPFREIDDMRRQPMTE